jgi:hypothetical protein
VVWIVWAGLVSGVKIAKRTISIRTREEEVRIAGSSRSRSKKKVPARLAAGHIDPGENPEKPEPVDGNSGHRGAERRRELPKDQKS